MIEILSFSFPQCKDLDHSKIAQKANICGLVSTFKFMFHDKNWQDTPTSIFLESFSFCARVSEKKLVF